MRDPINTASNVTSDGEGLTLAKLQAAIDSIPKMPPPSSFDLFGSVYITEAYELNLEKIMPPDRRGRRFLIVPQDALQAWHHELLRLGADVRLEPRLPASRAGSDAT